MRKVYIVNKGCHDHSDAQRFGELVYLSEGAINRYATSSMYREFMPKLLESSIEDFILPTGLTIMSNIACSMFTLIHGRLNMLIYKSSRRGGPGRYVERTILLDEMLIYTEETTDDRGTRLPDSTEPSVVQE